MFGIFKRKSKLEVLQEKYRKLLKQAHELSTSSRTESDKKLVEAQEILNEIDTLTGS